jgi:DNA-binding transcriptional LysR family regulator
VDLDVLASFVSVAEELHFRQAAQRTHLSQPALTGRIQRLERELGFALFFRNRRRVVLTPAGTFLLERARRLLADAEDMVAAASDVSSGQAGSLRVGYVGSALYTAIPAVMATLHDRVPDLEVVLVEYKTGPQLDLLARGLLDAGFVHLPPRPVAGIEVLDLGLEARMVALPSAHQLSARRLIRLDALAGESFVLSPQELDADGYQQVIEACAKGGFTPHVVQEASNLQSLIGLVAAGLGVALVAESVAKGSRRAGVVFRRLAPTLELHNALIWPAGHSNPALAELEKATRVWLDRPQGSRPPL